MSVDVADRYLADRVMTATPAELTGMLYDAAVGCVRSAIAHQEQGDWLAASPKLIKAQSIVMELRSALNTEAGGPLADRLSALYTYSFTKLLAANTKRDTNAAREVLNILTPIQLAWREACLRKAA